MRERAAGTIMVIWIALAISLAALCGWVLVHSPHAIEGVALANGFRDSEEMVWDYGGKLFGLAVALTIVVLILELFKDELGGPEEDDSLSDA